MKEFDEYYYEMKEIVELEEKIFEKVSELRSKGIEPKFIILDHNSHYFIQNSNKYVPSFMQKDKKTGDTIFGVRVASVSGGIEFMEIL